MKRLASMIDRRFNRTAADVAQRHLRNTQMVGIQSAISNATYTENTMIRVHGDSINAPPRVHVV